MGGTMVRTHPGWSQDSYSPKKSTSSGGQLPGPSSLFTTAIATPPTSRPTSSPHAGNISLPAPYHSDYTATSPTGQTPPHLPSLNMHAQAQRGSLGIRSITWRSDLCFLPAHSSLSSVRSVDIDLPYPTPNSRSQQPSSPGLVPRQAPARSISPREEVKQMSITSLLSKDSAPRSPIAPQPRQAATKSRIPSPAQPVPASEYRIHVRQQPLAARSCGFGERDRRVIDPPPIVQLNIDDPEATPEEISLRLRFQFTVLHCSIWNEAGDLDFSAMPEDYRQQRRLMGTLVASPFVGQDENGEEGCFFCFPDLSCRTPGSFRLKFALVVLDPLSMRPGASSPIMANAMSDAFTVYNAKDFPGMQASTALTKRLREQGCLISIKKGNDKTTAAHARDDSDDEAGDGSGKKSRKRVKRE